MTTQSLENKWREECADLMLSMGYSPLFTACRNQKEYSIYLAACKKRQEEFNEKDNYYLKFKQVELEKESLTQQLEEVRGYNCQLANENRKLQENAEVLIELAECRGDEDCDHCVAVAECKPCQLEKDIIESMKKEVTYLTQQLEEKSYRYGEGYVKLLESQIVKLTRQLKEKDNVIHWRTVETNNLKQLIERAIPWVDSIEYHDKHIQEWLEEVGKIL